MGANKVKYIIINPSLDISSQGRPSKSIDNILLKTPHENNSFISYRKFFMNIEIVDDIKTNEPIFRIKFPRDTFQKIEVGLVSVDWDNLQTFCDKLRVKYLERKSQVKTRVYRSC